MRLPRVLGLALLLAAAGCLTGAPGPEEEEQLGSEQAYIVGGQPATAGEFPAVLGLYDGSHLCTATLIHAEWALTAAHCVTPALTGHANQADVTAAFYLLLDDVDLTDQNLTARTVRLKETFMHPDWNPSSLGDNDVAVLHLAQPVTDRKVIPIYRLPVAPGTPVTQVGYGVSDPANKSGAGVLRTLNTSTARCSDYGYSDTNLVCFDANDGNGTCFGDSGGPTFVTVGGSPEVAGVTSFGKGDLCTDMDASTHVAGELEFIDAHVPRVTGGTPLGTDPSATPPIGPAPNILTGCSIGAGHAPAASSTSWALLVFGLPVVLLAVRRRRRA